jgi:hypothetical protein
LGELIARTAAKIDGRDYEAAGGGAAWNVVSGKKNFFDSRLIGAE